MLSDLLDKLLEKSIDFLGQSIEERPWIVIATLLTISALIANHDKLLWLEPWVKSIVLPIVSAVIAFAVLKMVMISKKLSQMEKEILISMDTVARLPVFLDKLSTHIKFEDNFERFIQDHPPATSIRGSLARHLKDYLFKRLSVDNGHQQFSAKNKWAAIEVYELFWRELNDFQKNSTSSLKCYAINSSSLDIWSGVDGRLFLDIQAEFCNGKDHQKGEVHRILCYSLTDFKNDTDLGKQIKSVAVAMIQARVSVYLYDTDESPVERGFNCRQIENDFFRTWDFLVVEGREESIIWEAENSGKQKCGTVLGMPKKAVCAGSRYYIDDEIVDLKGLWDVVKKYSLELELAEDQSNENGLTVKIKEDRD